jgi:hypothetical protein
VQVGSSIVNGKTQSSKVARGYEIRALDTSEFARWDEFVRQSPQGTLFHTSLWLEALGAPFRLFGYFRGKELYGGFATGLIGRRCAGRPHPSLTPYLGILYPQSNAKYVTRISTEKEIARAFAAFLKNEFDRVDFRFPPEVVDLQPFIWEGFSAGLRYTYRLSLSSLKTILDNMDTKRRTKLASAERQGVQVEVGADFADVMRLSDRSFQRQGLMATIRPAAERVEATLRQAGRCLGFLACSREGEPLSSVWIAWDEKRAYCLLGGYEHSAKSNNAVSLAMWRTIQFTVTDLKLPEFDFEGSMIPAVEQFYRKFGATLTPTYTIHYQRPTIGRRAARKLVRLMTERG